MIISKKLLRREMRARLKAETANLRNRSEALRAQIYGASFWRESRTVGLFCPLPEEPDLLALMEDGVRRFVFPRIAGEALTWHEVSDVSLLRANAAGGLERLREPVGGAFVGLDEMDLLLVPGLAFTSEGRRLGRGGGYYDRVLAAPALRAMTVGVCFEFQIVETLPLEAHDMAVQRVCWA
jgi:5-formyltetrahydrofolate cyclo-ligase